MPETPTMVDVWLARNRYWWHCNACDRTSRKGYGYAGTAERYGNAHYRDKHRKGSR